MPEPSAEAVADLIAQAKAIGLDLAKGSWKRRRELLKRVI